MQGLKLDHGKERYSLLPCGFLREVVLVLECGAVKYAPDNWKKVESAKSRYYDAAMRHLHRWWELGEKVDQESGLHHLAHVACNTAFLFWLDKQEKDS